MQENNIVDPLDNQNLSEDYRKNHEHNPAGDDARLNLKDILAFLLSIFSSLSLAVIYAYSALILNFVAALSLAKQHIVAICAIFFGVAVDYKIYYRCIETEWQVKDKNFQAAQPWLWPLSIFAGVFATLLNVKYVVEALNLFGFAALTSTQVVTSITPLGVAILVCNVLLGGLGMVFFNKYSFGKFTQDQCWSELIVKLRELKDINLFKFSLVAIGIFLLIVACGIILYANLPVLLNGASFLLLNLPLSMQSYFMATQAALYIGIAVGFVSNALTLVANIKESIIRIIDSIIASSKNTHIATVATAEQITKKIPWGISSNPLRLLIDCFLNIAEKMILFIHCLFVGLTTDQAEGIPTFALVLVGTAIELFTDLDFFWHKEEDTHNMAEHHGQHTHHHNHNDNKFLLALLAAPLVILEAFIYLCDVLVYIGSADDAHKKANVDWHELFPACALVHAWLIKPTELLAYSFLQWSSSLFRQQDQESKTLHSKNNTSPSSNTLEQLYGNNIIARCGMW